MKIHRKFEDFTMTNLLSESNYQLSLAKIIKTTRNLLIPTDYLFLYILYLRIYKYRTFDILLFIVSIINFLLFFFSLYEKCTNIKKS